jgi:formylmethanofuran dehydrogenase subunit C
MGRGTIVSLVPLRLLPTFAYACTYTPIFLRVYARHLARLGFEIPDAGPAGSYRRYTGDNAVPGKGEILVWQPAASAPQSPANQLP